MFHIVPMPHGQVAGDDRTIRFEPASTAPGLYRIDLDATHSYIGEARNLATRFSGYRSSGGSVETLVPRTNRRVQRKFLDALAAGPTVPVQLCTAATLTMAGETRSLPLVDKTRRLLVEAAAILAENEIFTLETFTVASSGELRSCSGLAESFPIHSGQNSR